MVEFLGALLLFALIIMVAMFLLIMTRQAAVIILIIIAPIAFALAILPNTKSLFTKWRKAFVGMLILWPEIAAIVGGSALASKIFTTLSNNYFKGQGGMQTNTMLGNFWLIASLGILIIPLVAIPFVMKGSLSALGKIGGMVAGFAAGRVSAQRKRTAASAGRTRVGQAYKGIKENWKARQEATAARNSSGRFNSRIRGNTAKIAGGTKETLQQRELTMANNVINDPKATDAQKANAYSVIASENERQKKLARSNLEYGLGKFANKTPDDKHNMLANMAKNNNLNEFEKVALAEDSGGGFELEESLKWLRDNKDASADVTAAFMGKMKENGFVGQGDILKMRNAKAAGNYDVNSQNRDILGSYAKVTASSVQNMKPKNLQYAQQQLDAMGSGGGEFSAGMTQDDKNAAIENYMASRRNVAALSDRALENTSKDGMRQELEAQQAQTKGTRESITTQHQQVVDAEQAAQEAKDKAFNATYDEAQKQNQSFDAAVTARSQSNQLTIDHRNASQDLANAQVAHQTAMAGGDDTQKILAQQNLRDAERVWNQADSALRSNQRTINDHEKKYGPLPPKP